MRCYRRSQLLYLSLIVRYSTQFISAPVSFRPYDRPLACLSNSNNMETDNTLVDGSLLFGRFRISSTQIFYRSQSGLSFAFVNLRPIVQGHVLVCPTRVVPKLEHLDTQEFTDLWLCVKRVQLMLRQVYFPNFTDDEHIRFGFNVAVQDGQAAGQSVPHVHVHILPRSHGDFAQNDSIYDELADWAPRLDMVQWKQNHGLGSGSIHVPEDDKRPERTMQEMETEASIYRNQFLKHM
jgi:bis(5'-adenosyl)-triphosphatase